MIALILSLIIGTLVRWLFTKNIDFSTRSEVKQWVGVMVIGLIVCYGLHKAGADGFITWLLVAVGAFFGKYLAEKASKVV